MIDKDKMKIVTHIAGILATTPDLIIPCEEFDLKAFNVGSSGQSINGRWTECIKIVFIVAHVKGNEGSPLEVSYIMLLDPQKIKNEYNSIFANVRSAFEDMSNKIEDLLKTMNPIEINDAIRTLRLPPYLIPESIELIKKKRITRADGEQKVKHKVN